MPVKQPILSQKLGYSFRQAALLDEALSHRSAQGKNNERLEFLGDSVLNFLIAAALYEHFPQAREGELSRLRAELVREETLASLAQELALGDYLRLGVGEMKSGGATRISILADALEAVIGAIYLDGGLTACQQCVLTWYAERLTTINQQPGQKDAKTLLQEWVQARKLPLPDYRIVAVEGAAHQQTFQVECRLKSLAISVTATGSSRRRAEQAAAKQVLEVLQHE